MIKKIFAFALAALTLVSVMLTMTACASKYAVIERNFLDNGYEIVDTTHDENSANYLSITASLEDGEVSCTVHVLKKGRFLDNTLQYAIIAEYKGNKQAAEALNEYLEGNLATVLKDLDEAKIVNGNCLLIPIVLNLDVEENLKAMLDLFNK